MTTGDKIILKTRQDLWALRETGREMSERACEQRCAPSIIFSPWVFSARSLPLSTRAAAHNFALSFIQMSQNDYILTHYFSPIFFLSGGFRKMWFIPFNSYHFRESTDNSCRVANAPAPSSRLHSNFGKSNNPRGSIRLGAQRRGDIRDEKKLPHRKGKGKMSYTFWQIQH